MKREPEPVFPQLQRLNYTMSQRGHSLGLSYRWRLGVDREMDRRYQPLDNEFYDEDTE